MERAEITIIGAGVVGLAIAARLAETGKQIYVLEKNDSFGRETSSRNSGIIHSGVYYPEGTLKARLCLTGNKLLYELCQKYNIDHRRLGKLIVAAIDNEILELKALWEQGQRNGVENLKWLSRKELKEFEPNVTGAAALFSPDTGIIDVHVLMRYFSGRAAEGGAVVAYRSEVIALEKTSSGYRVTVKDKGCTFTFVTRILINSAGLYSDRIAELAGIDVERAGYRLHYCKGEYFSVGNNKHKLLQRLVFPVPETNLTGVGIHVIFDLDGRMRLGPSAEYIDSLDYNINDKKQPFFYHSVRNFLPFIEYQDLAPEMAGIRPKLQGPGEATKDFVIQEESGRGLPCLINLIGIESPGLTASPAIADHVFNLVRELA